MRFPLLTFVVRSCLCVFAAWSAAGREAGGAGVNSFLVGADISALPVYEGAGVKYRAAGREWDAVPLLRRVGVNAFRLRLFVKPNGEGVVTNDLDYTLRLARRIKASGAEFLLDIHYSDTWADPSRQDKPEAWAKLKPSELEAEIGRYTTAVLERFKKEGVAPSMVQVGNEISTGMLWPDGKVEFAVQGGDEHWTSFLALWGAGVRAVHATLPAARVYLHLASTGNLPHTRWFLDRVKTSGLAIDGVGFSYYPEWHGTLKDLKETLEMAARDYPWPVLVMEVAYPWKHDNHFDGRPNMAFPLTPAGQAGLLKAVVEVVRDVPAQRGLGVFYWQPEAVVNDSVDTWLAGSCSLFDDRGQILPGAGFGLAPGSLAQPSSSK